MKTPLSIPRTHELLGRYRDMCFPLENPGYLSVHTGKGSFLTDHDGKEYIDLSAGLGCLPFGYGDRRTIDILTRQASKLIHAGSEILTEESLALAEELTHWKSGYTCFFSNSGAEANEAALKLARRFCAESYSSDKHEIVAFHNAFHGRTLFNISVAGNSVHTQGFAPLVPGIRHLDLNDVEAFEAVIGPNTCAVILEVIQGKGGGNEVSPAFVEAIARARDRYGFLLLVDDIQTGVGRLGNLFGFDLFGLDPDVFTLAKALGGGLPIGVTMARRAFAEVMKVGTHGTTFGGSPLATTVALDTLQRIADPIYLKNVEVSGLLIRQSLEALNQKFGCFSTIRGRGLMLFAELKAPFDNHAMVVQQAAMEAGVILRTSGDSTIRLTPALNIDEYALSIAFERLRIVFQMLRARLRSETTII